MRDKLLLSAAILVCSALASQAKASTYQIQFSGTGVSGSLLLTYGTSTDAKYSGAFEVTGISGTFTDTNNGLNIVNAAILGLVPINHATPESTNLLAPNDFSRFAVATGLPADNGGFLTYDNLLWPGGSPQTASDYPAYGGILDIYGLMFSINGGDVVDLWSNGHFAPNAPIDYGVAVATSSTALDYVGGVVVTPEPGSFCLMATGMLAIGLLLWRRPGSLRADV